MQADLRSKVADICLAFPEAARSMSHGGHDSYSVRGKKFAYFLDNHHGDGRIAINVRAMPGEQSRLVEQDAERFFVPAYLGPRGWVGLRIDLGDVDWAEAERLITDSYLLQAPRKLAALLG